MRTSLRTVLLLALVTAAVWAPVPEGAALDVEDLALSISKPEDSKDYGGIVGNNTSLTHRPSECRTAVYCDVIDLQLDANGFAENDTYKVNFVLRWESFEGASDLDLYIYDPEEVRVGESPTGDQPEETSIDTPPSGTYFIVINNFAGPNDGYKMEVSLEHTGTLKEIPKFERATPRPQFTPLPESTPRIKRPEQELTPTATLAPVLTPGPDGEPATFALAGVSAQARLEEGPAWWVIGLSVLAAVVVLGGTGYFLFRRVRAART